MTLHGIICVIFKQTNAANMRVCGFIVVKRAVEIGRICWAVIAPCQFERIWPKPVVCIEISSQRLNRIIT